MHRLFYNKIELLLELKIISSIKLKCDDTMFNMEIEGPGLENDPKMTFGMTLGIMLGRTYEKNIRIRGFGIGCVLL